VAQHQQLDVFGCRRPDEQGEPAANPYEDQVERGAQTWLIIIACHWPAGIAAAHRARILTHTRRTGATSAPGTGKRHESTATGFWAG